MINPQLNNNFINNQEEETTEIKKSTVVNKKDYNALCKKIDALWTKLNRDRLNSMLINEIVRWHLTWVSSDAKLQQEAESSYETTIQNVNLKGKNPQIYEAVETLQSEYCTLFKIPDNLFSIEGDIDTPDGYDAIYKQYLLDKIYKADIINSLILGLEKENWRGENILKVEWEQKKEKRRVQKPSLGENEQPELNEDGTQKLDWVIEEYIDFEGVFVKAIEPNDFCFDITKLGSFSTSLYDQSKFASPVCCKIERKWMSIKDIENNYDLSKDDIEKLEQTFDIKTISPASEQVQDDYTNRFFRRYTNGDLIEVLEYWGNIGIPGAEYMEDMHIVTARSEIVLKCENNPYTFCPYLWKPAIPDLYSRRGLSPLVPAIEYNEFSTNLLDSVKRILKFAINPAYFVNEGTHLIDEPKEINPGDFVRIGDGLGSGQFPQPIEVGKNIPLSGEFFAMMEKFINKSTGVSENQTGDPDIVNMTATQNNNIATQNSFRMSRNLLTYSQMILIPVIKMIAKLYSENIDYGKVERIKVNKQIIEINDAIRNGKYTFNIGSTQTMMEKKNQRADFMQFLTAAANPAILQNYDMKEIINWGSEPSCIQNAERFLIQNNPQQQQMQQQIQQLTQQLQQVQQQSQQEKAQLLSMPSVLQNKIKNDIVATTLSRINVLPEDFIELEMQSLGVQPTTEMIEARQKEVEKQATRHLHRQQSAGINPIPQQFNQ